MKNCHKYTLVFQLFSFDPSLETISSNFEKLHESKEEAYAENLGCLSHWEPRNLPRPPQLWARCSDPFDQIK